MDTLSLLQATASSLLVANYSGPSDLNKQLHVLPACTFSGGCDALPFSDDPNYMVSDAGIRLWAQRIVMAGFIPLALILIYVVTDTMVRCIRHCCCRHLNGGAPVLQRRRGCCSRCCCAGCADSFDDGVGIDDRAADGSFLSPAARVSLVPGGYGSAVESGAFPSADIDPTVSGRRGATAGQTTDRAFRLLHDPESPFSSTSRVIAVSSRELEIEQARAQEQADMYALHAAAASGLLGGVDKVYPRRMAWSWCLTTVAVALLALSILFVARGDDAYNAFRSDVIAVQDYFGSGLQDGPLASLQGDLSGSVEVLGALSAAAGPNTSHPLSNDQALLVSQLSLELQAVSEGFFAPFSARLDAEATHGSDARRAVDRVGQARQHVEYWVTGVAMLAAILLLLVHVCCSRRPGLALLVGTLYALSLVALATLAAMTLSVAVGFGDACMEPLQYAQAALNASYVTDGHFGAQGLTEVDREEIRFYLSCEAGLQQDQQPSYMSNPLYTSFVGPAFAELSGPGSDIALKLGQVEAFINASRPDLVLYSDALSALNVSALNHMDDLANQLNCQDVHANFIDAFEKTCHPLMQHTWIACVLQFIACLFLLMLRCCVWMRRGNGRRGGSDDDDEGPRVRTTHGVSVTPFAPYTGHSEVKDDIEGGDHGAQTFGSTNMSWSSKATARAY